MARWKIAGINFDHFHMLDNLRDAANHADAEVVAVCDEQPDRMREAVSALSLTDDQVFGDYRQCLETARPDVVILCPATSEHHLWTARVAEYGVHILTEKPFAASLADADAMAEAVQRRGKQLAVNWPLAWYPAHRTAKRIIDDGVIGDVIEVHYYDGNRGPLWHTAGKAERTAETVASEKPGSWFYKRSRGGGSLLDYLGYGTTLSTWFLGGRQPLEVTTTVDQPEGLEVDEHSITVARYPFGLSKFETRWGTYSDPWTFQPQPKCGFVIVGTKGTVSSYDLEPTVRIQTAAHPEGQEVAVDQPSHPTQNGVQYLLDCLEKERLVEGPLSPAISRVGQQIVDSAVLSVAEKRTVQLVNR